MGAATDVDRRNPVMKRARILLADDHTLMAEALQHLLQADFDVVGTVSDGRALIKAAAELKPELVVVDIGMPLLNGLDAADQLKALHPDIKVIFLTQNREPRYAVEAFRRKASGWRGPRGPRARDGSVFLRRDWPPPARPKVPPTPGRAPGFSIQFFVFPSEISEDSAL